MKGPLGMTERRASARVGADRKSIRYRSYLADYGDLRSRLRELAQRRRRVGYRGLHILLRRDGITINLKKAQRLHREKELTVILAKAHQGGALEKQLAIRPELLIIDELGYLPLEANTAHLFFQLVSRRYQRGSILLP